MITKLLKNLYDAKLCDWGVILIGVVGFPGIEERLDPEAIREFARADFELTAATDPAFDYIIELLELRELSEVQTREILEKICYLKHADLSISFRKWRYVSILEVVSNLGPDPIYGFLKLLEFWNAWAWPNDGPPSMQELSGLSPTDLDSRIKYESVVKEHHEWLKKELDSLRINSL